MTANLVQTLIAPIVEGEGYRLVRARLTGSQRKTLQVMAERPDGTMDVEDCAKLSRLLSERLDEADPIAEDYVLEVSSPGIDRPLTAEEDFVRFAGHEARVELGAAGERRRRFKGELKGMESGAVVMLVPDQGEMRFPLADIQDAKLVLTDRLIRESLKRSDANKA